MTVSCKMSQCPHYDINGFCAKPHLVSIDENGMCSVLWKNGQQRNLGVITREMYPKTNIIVEEWKEKDSEKIAEKGKEN